MNKLRFLVSLTTKDNDYQIEQAQSAEEAARKFCIELQVIYADNDAITQSTQLLKAIHAEESHRPNAIILSPYLRLDGAAPSIDIEARSSSSLRHNSAQFLEAPLVRLIFSQDVGITFSYP